MKKRFEMLKTVQLVIFLVLAAVALIIIFTDRNLYQMVGRDPSIRWLCALLWIVLVLSFIFILIDFRTNSFYKKDYRELDYVVHNDHIAGIANRYSCDAMIERYADKKLPPEVGCVMLEIANLGEINAMYGRTGGNRSIQNFSDILNTASLGLCFVGRNGGNQFMALFESCDEVKLNVFLNRVARKVEAYNAGNTPRIEFRSGQAFREGEEVQSITQLIALAVRRITNKTDTVAGIANRDSCDEIIAQYLDKPLPPELGCIMFNLANLQEINETRGHIEGNRVIRQFADILRESSHGMCFVGRNGGTNFLAIFETCTCEKMDTFIQNVCTMTGTHNERLDHSVIHFTWGSAFDEGDKAANISQLLSLASRRIREHSN